MSADLPDYTRKVIVDQEIEGSTHLAVDLEKVKGDDILTPTIAKTVPVGIENENIRDATADPTVANTFPVSVENPAIKNATADPTVEHTVPTSVENPAIKNATKTPSVDNTVPISVENPALAYDPTNDEFYVRSRSSSRPVYVDIASVLGTAQTGLNWSAYIAYLARIPASPATEGGNLASILAALERVATPVSIDTSTSGDNTVVTPSSGKKIQVMFITIHNSSDASVTVYLKFAAGGTARFKKALASGAGFAANLLGANWQGAANEALIINLSAAKNITGDILYREV